MAKDKKATVYAYVGHNRGVVVDFEGNKKRNGWVKLNLELDQEECIEKLSWTNGTWGSNNIVIRRDDMNQLVGQLLTLADAMIGDKEQRDAWKNLLRRTIHDWHDTKFNRFNLFTGDTPHEVDERNIIN